MDGHAELACTGWHALLVSTVGGDGLVSDQVSYRFDATEQGTATESSPSGAGSGRGGG